MSSAEEDIDSIIDRVTGAHSRETREAFRAKVRGLRQKGRAEREAQVVYHPSEEHAQAYDELREELDATRESVYAQQRTQHEMLRHDVSRWMASATPEQLDSVREEANIRRIAQMTPAERFWSAALCVGLGVAVASVGWKARAQFDRRRSQK